MNDGLIVAIAVLAAVVLLFVLLRTVMVTFKRSLLVDIEKKLAGRTPIRQTLAANFFGKRSRGGAQIRGNGALVLTEDELFFLMGLPRREIRIPLEHITSVTLPKSFLGKTVFRPLLCVEYHSRLGTDSIAWAINDQEGWKADIEKTKK